MDVDVGLMEIPTISASNSAVIHWSNSLSNLNAKRRRLTVPDLTAKLTAEKKIDAALSRIEVLLSSIAKQQTARLELAEFARIRALAKEQADG